MGSGPRAEGRGPRAGQAGQTSPRRLKGGERISQADIRSLATKPVHRPLQVSTEISEKF